MTHYIITILVCFFTFCLHTEAQNISTIFTTMPDQYVPQLESAWRKDLVDLYNSGKEAKLKNIMNGFSVLKTLTPDFLEIQSTDRCTIQMKLLPLINHTYIICMVTTVFGPVPDSRINFFTTDWRPIKNEEVIDPLPKGWYLKNKIDLHSNTFIEAVSQIEMDLCYYHLDPKKSTLSIEYTTPQSLGIEAREALKPYLRPEMKIYKWNKSRFK